MSQLQDSNYAEQNDWTKKILIIGESLIMGLEMKNWNFTTGMKRSIDKEVSLRLIHKSVCTMYAQYAVLRPFAPNRGCLQFHLIALNDTSNSSQCVLYTAVGCDYVNGVWITNHPWNAAIGGLIPAVINKTATMLIVNCINNRTHSNGGMVIPRVKQTALQSGKLSTGVLSQIVILSRIYIT